MTGTSRERDRAAVLLRQGDVLLMRVDGLPGGTEARQQTVERTGGRLVLAEGEASGHAHSIDGPGAKLVSVRPRDSRAMMRTYLVVTRPQALRHEEHDPVSIDLGVYEVRRQREYSPDSFAWAAD